MEIGGVSGLGAGESPHRGVNKAAGELHSPSSTRLKEHRHGSHEHGRRTEHHHKSRLANVLRQEIRQVLSASFRLSFSASLPAYVANAGDATTADVAADTLSAAKQLAAQSPLAASTALVSLRSKVEQAASSVRETLGDSEQHAIDETMSAVSKGLDDQDRDAARNVVSSASVLSAETSLRQRSTISIRTQEGDVVRLDLRRAESMFASDVSVTDGDRVVSETRVDISSRTRSVLLVDGDLNEAEMAAIQSVFAQAEAIASEFFGGDLAAAFDMAAGLEFDTEQLSKVNVRFREKQVSNISYATIQSVSQQPATTNTQPVAAVPAPAEPKAPTAVTEDAPPKVSAEPEIASVVPTVDDNAIDGMAELLSNFLRAANEAFESGSFRYHYSESFKLEILKSVLQVNAPDESGGAANAAAAVIDAVTETVAN